MRRILLISDTHGTTAYVKIILEKVGPVDEVWHMGDVEGQQSQIRKLAGCPVIFVRGNCDSGYGDPEDRILEVEGHRIFMTHGHTHGINWDMTGLVIDARAAGADIAIYGHTHKPHLEYLDGLMVINPGSASRPRQAGFQKSYALLELKEGQFPCYCSIAYLKDY